MPKSIDSTCIQHPGFQAVGRCKQCGKPFCSQCEVHGPIGIFCSTPCKNANEVFVQRAAQLDSMSKKTSIIFKLISSVKSLIALVILIIMLGVIAHYFEVDVPVVSDMLGGQIPTEPTE